MNVSALNLIGKLLGMAKNLMIAAIFGATATLDAFWVAYLLPFTIPSIVKGVAATVFIPRFMASIRGDASSSDWRGANTFFSCTVILVGVFALLLIIWPEVAVYLTAPELDSETAALAADVLRYMSLGMILLGASAALTALSYAFDRFTVPALESVISNVAIILTCIFLTESMGLMGLVIGVLIGPVLHFLLLVYDNRAELIHRVRPAMAFSHPDFNSSVKQLTPLLVGYGSALTMSIVDQIFASGLASGSISVFSYAMMLAGLPMAVFGEAVLNTFYTPLSRYNARGSAKRMLVVLMRGLRILIIGFVPISVALIVFRETFVSLLFEHGNFGSDDTVLTANTMAALALGLTFHAVAYLNFRIFHAMNRSWVPVSIGVFGAVINVYLDWLFIDRYGIAGIALATSVTGILSAAISAVLVIRTLKVSLTTLVAWRLLKLTIGLTLSCSLLYGAFEALTASLVWFPDDVVLQRMVEFSAFLLATLILLGLSYVFKVPEVRMPINRLLAAVSSR